MNPVDEIKDLLVDVGKDIGHDLADGLDALSEYAAERAKFLAQHVNAPDFYDILRRERHNVAAAGGIISLDAAGDIDEVLVEGGEQLLGAIHGGLRVLAKVLREALDSA